MCASGLETFIKPIVDCLSKKTKTKLILAGPNGWESQLSDHKDYQLLWLEWANELAVTMTRNPKALSVLEGKKVVMRCHSYEVLSGLFQNVDLTKLDAIIFVADHVKDVAMKLSAMKTDQALTDRLSVWTIPNGIDMERFKFSNKSRGTDLAFVGHISHKKGFPLLLHAFRELPDSYRLHVAGEFQDYRFKFYADHILKRFGGNTKERVIFHGKVNDVASFLSSKSFIVSSSPWEGHPVNIIEGMAMGLKPVVHDFMGASDMYEGRWIWTTIDDFIDIVHGREWEPESYRQHMEHEGWTLDVQMERIEAMLKDLRLPKSTSSIDTKISPKIEAEVEMDVNDIRSNRLKIVPKREPNTFESKKTMQFAPDGLESWPPYMRKAFEWVTHHVIQSGSDHTRFGVAVSSNVKCDVIYPEVTGYLIPTLLGLGARELAWRFARCLVMDFQNQDGGFPGPGGGESIAFDTAQVLRGLFWSQNAGMDPAILDQDILMKSVWRAVEWLDSQLTDDGFIVKNLESYAMPEGRSCPQVVNLYSIVPFIKTAMLTGQWSPKMDRKAQATVNFYLKDSLSFRNRNMLSHFFFYCIDGMVELSENCAWAYGLKKQAEDIILKETLFLPKASFMIPGFSDVQWVCSPGQAQAAICFWKLGMQRRFELAMSAAKMLQEPSGGFLGSYGTGDNWYFPASELPWAVKFFLDACMMEQSLKKEA